MTRVLIIDDDRRLTEPMQYQLETLEYTVAVAHDGPTGLHMTLSEKPDVIVLDIMLPGMDGWQVCQEIRRFSQIPIIMLTALGLEIDRIHGLELGADDYLTKPFSFQELLAHIVHIRWLRQKIEDDPATPIYIQTVRNVGYRFAAAEEIQS